MKTNKHTTTDFTPERAEYQLVLPLDYSVMIPEDDSVRLQSQVVEKLDLRDPISNRQTMKRGKGTAFPSFFEMILRQPLDN